MRYKTNSKKDWVRKLPKGSYTTKDLLEHGAPNDNLASKYMLRYGAYREKFVDERNRILNIYHWSGWDDSLEEKDK